MELINATRPQPANRMRVGGPALLRVALAAAVALLWGGCSTPVGVKAVDTAQWRETVKGAAAGDGQLARAILDSWQVLAAGDGDGAQWDARRQAAALAYNQALLGLVDAGGRPADALVFPETEVALPGTGQPVTIRKGASFAGFAEIGRFFAADAFEVRGLRVRNRQDGVGVPLIGLVEDDRTDYRRTVPVTLMARVEEAQAGRAGIVLELVRADESGLAEVGGNRLPLACDTTAPMAYALDDRKVWSLGRSLFFDSDLDLPGGIYPERPHQPGRIPVVLIHGTISSPVVWAELVNYLHADPVITDRYEFWFFIYRSGNPVTFSADILRAEIARLRGELDPAGTDPALRRMVVIGHSQGGLLARLVSTEPGDRLWQAISSKPFDAIQIADSDRELIRSSFFFEPLPGVRRTVYLATPHRGTAKAKGPLSWLARKILHIPGRLTSVATSLLDPRNEIRIPGEVRNRVPHSMDSMSPTNPWLLALADLPVPPAIPAHSVIGIADGKTPPEGTDGVVTYRSAHLDGVESELLIDSKHSLQAHPGTLAEVRRILHLHLE